MPVASLHLLLQMQTKPYLNTHAAASPLRCSVRPLRKLSARHHATAAYLPHTTAPCNFYRTLPASVSFSLRALDCPCAPAYDKFAVFPNAATRSSSRAVGRQRAAATVRCSARLLASAVSPGQTGWAHAQTNSPSRARRETPPHCHRTTLQPHRNASRPPAFFACRDARPLYLPARAVSMPHLRRLLCDQRGCRAKERGGTLPAEGFSHRFCSLYLSWRRKALAACRARHRTSYLLRHGLPARFLNARHVEGRAANGTAVYDMAKASGAQALNTSLYHWRPRTRAPLAHLPPPPATCGHCSHYLFSTCLRLRKNAGRTGRAAATTALRLLAQLLSPNVPF